jgi:hypothetical protein
MIQTPESESHNRLLIIVHHLAVDGVSWRILLEDLEQLITHIGDIENFSLGKKSSFLQQWFDGLKSYGNTNRLLSQKTYWENAVPRLSTYTGGQGE